MEALILALGLAGFIYVADANQNPLWDIEGDYDEYQVHEEVPSKIPPLASAQHIVFSNNDYYLANAEKAPTPKTTVSAKKMNATYKNVYHSSKQGIGNNISHCLDVNYKLYFEHNKYKILEVHHGTLSKIVNHAASCGVNTLYIRGHASKVGLINYNIKLATKRGHSVGNALQNRAPIKVIVLNPLTEKETIRKHRFAAVTFNP